MTDEINITVCERCTTVREATIKKCPYCNKMTFEEWFEQSDEDPEYISISRTAWYAGQENK